MGPSSFVVVVLLTLSLTTHRSDTAPVTGSNDTTTEPAVDKQQSYRTSSVDTSCSLSAVDDSTAATVNSHLAAGANLVKFYLQFQDKDSKVQSNSSSPMYKPLYWVRTPGRLGNGLLLLRPEYDVLSLMTLEISVITMHVKVQMYPNNCISSLNTFDAEKVLRALVMSNFKNSSAPIDVERPNDRVCNLHATDKAGIVDFRYLCCRLDGPDYIYCKYLSSDIWLDILFVLLMIIKILVILFSPRFVPDALYRLKHQPAPYLHKCLDDKKVTLDIIATNQPEAYTSEGMTTNTFPMSAFNSMEIFKRCLKTIEPEKPYRLTLDQITLQVAEERLLAAAEVPVGLFKTLKNSFVLCQISERDALTECCLADAFEKLPCKRKCTFFNFCTSFMQFVLMLLLAVPWILRVAAYYEYEHDEMSMRKLAAKQRGLEFYFPQNLILLLTPIHALFIASYIILSIELCLFGILGRFGSQASEKLKYVVRQCFRNMREMDNTKVIGWAVKLMLRPCAECGLVGFLLALILWPLMLPIIILVLAFYIFPTVNITFRLFYHFYIFICPCGRQPWLCRKFKEYTNFDQLVFTDEMPLKVKRLERRILRSFANRFYQVLILISCLLTMYALILLIYEFVSFVAEIIVYTIMGMILNAGTLLTYVSLAILVGIYGQTCFGNVTTTFVEFNKSMNSIVLGMASDEVETVIYQKADVQPNMSFAIKTDKCSEVEFPVQLVKGADGSVNWNVKRLLLFLDKNDGPHIPSRLYFNACKMDYYAVPGDVLVRYLRAFREFGIILLFLLFVLLVVMAFGESFDISTSNRLLATVLGGIVPLLLRNFLFKSYSPPAIDKNSIPFKVFFTDLVDPYEEDWPVYDIEVDAEKIQPMSESSFDGKFDLVIELEK